MHFKVGKYFDYYIANKLNDNFLLELFYAKILIKIVE